MTESPCSYINFVSSVWNRLQFSYIRQWDLEIIKIYVEGVSNKNC